MTRQLNNAHLFATGIEQDIHPHPEGSGGWSQNGRSIGRRRQKLYDERACATGQSRPLQGLCAEGLRSRWRTLAAGGSLGADASQHRIHILSYEYFPRSNGWVFRWLGYALLSNDKPSVFTSLQGPGILQTPPLKSVRSSSGSDRADSLLGARGSISSRSANRCVLLRERGQYKHERKGREWEDPTAPTWQLADQQLVEHRLQLVDSVRRQGRDFSEWGEASLTQKEARVGLGGRRRLWRRRRR